MSSWGTGSSSRSPETSACPLGEWESMTGERQIHHATREFGIEFICGLSFRDTVSFWPSASCATALSWLFPSTALTEKCIYFVDPGPLRSMDALEDTAPFWPSASWVTALSQPPLSYGLMDNDLRQLFIFLPHLWETG